MLVHDGETMSGNLERHRITLSELEAEMRLAGVSHLRHVEWAILEMEGKVSVIHKDERPTNRPKDDGPAR